MQSKCLKTVGKDRLFCCLGGLLGKTGFVFPDVTTFCCCSYNQQKRSGKLTFLCHSKTINSFFTQVNCAYKQNLLPGVKNVNFSKELGLQQSTLFRVHSADLHVQNVLIIATIVTVRSKLSLQSFNWTLANKSMKYEREFICCREEGFPGVSAY